jgi:hypothetical protein
LRRLDNLLAAAVQLVNDVNRSRLVTGLGGEDNTAISTFGVVLSGKTTSSFPSFLSCLGFLFLHVLILV